MYSVVPFEAYKGTHFGVPGSWTRSTDVTILVMLFGTLTFHFAAAGSESLKVGFWTMVIPIFGLMEIGHSGKAKLKRALFIFGTMESVLWGSYFLGNAIGAARSTTLVWWTTVSIIGVMILFQFHMYNWKRIDTMRYPPDRIALEATQG